MTDFDRRSVLAAGMVLSAWPGALAFAKKPPVVLFVCEFGTAKSAIARELFRRRAKERGIAVTAFSRGLALEDHVSPPLRQRLEAEGIETRGDGFAILAEKDVRAADLVIGFTPLPGRFHPRRFLDWSALPSVNDAWPKARPELDRRIDQLLDAIVAGRGRAR